MRKASLAALSILAALAGCENEPVKVGSNVEALEIDKVDLLLVVDNSTSMQGLQAELPDLLESFAAGSDEPGDERPALSDIHVAVVSTDMGALGTYELAGSGCAGGGDDGVFIPLTSEEIEQCNPDFQSFVEYDQDQGQITTDIAVACLPDVGSDGCGFEQPLEAMLKALWPASNDAIEFVRGRGHGMNFNEGFLREDSLLVIVVVSDEDDCSTDETAVFIPDDRGLNTICATSESLYDVDRYVQGLKDLRAADDDPIIFVTIAGVPEPLAAGQADVDLGDPEEIEAYYDEVLDDDAMQIAIDDKETPEDVADDNVVPSCFGAELADGSGREHKAYPPRRLIEVAKAFGPAGVVGSICADDFAATIGGVIRATAEKL